MLFYRSSGYTGDGEAGTASGGGAAYCGIWCDRVFGGQLRRFRSDGGGVCDRSKKAASTCGSDAAFAVSSGGEEGDFARWF